MGIFRSFVLTAGPVGLIGLSYITASPQHPDWQRDWTDLSRSATAISMPRLSETPPESYHRASHQILNELPASWPVIDRFPFLVTGNLPIRDLQRSLDEVVFPTYRALMIDYFDTPPAQPITLVLLSDEQAFVDIVGRMGYAGRQEYAGLYSRRDRRLIINLATGDGTIAHELTHALAHADFLKMPEWFDEGLAALHEECVFSKDGRRLIGQPNWRDRLLKDALADPSPPRLEELVTGSFGRGSASLDYAFARSFCRYLQSQQLLGVYFRKCRARIHDDPTGGLALLEITGCRDFNQLDKTFRHWFQAQ